MLALLVNQEHGLMVPVVRNADATSLKEVAQNLAYAGAEGARGHACSLTMSPVARSR